MAVIGFDFSVKCGGINVVGNWCCFMEFSLGLEIFTLGLCFRIAVLEISAFTSSLSSYQRWQRPTHNEIKKKTGETAGDLSERCSAVRKACLVGWY